MLNEATYGLALGLITVVLFSVVAQRIRRKHEIELVLKLIALAGIAACFFALLHECIHQTAFRSRRANR